VHSHHIEFRSKGGSDELHNQGGQCDGHHLGGVHAGTIKVWGRAPDGLTWQLGLRPGRPVAGRGPGASQVERGPGASQVERGPGASQVERGPGAEDRPPLLTYQPSPLGPWRCDVPPLTP